MQAEVEKMPKQIVIQKIMKWIQLTLEHQLHMPEKNHLIIQKLIKLVVELSATVTGSYSQNEDSSLSLENLFDYCIAKLKGKEDS